MALVTTDIIRQHVETDVTSAAIDRIIAATEAEVVKRYGPHHADGGAVVEAFTMDSPTDVLWLSRKASSITSAVCRYVGDLATADVTVDATGYVLENGGRSLRRIGDYWAPITTVTFVRTDDDAQRVDVIIDVVKAALDYQADPDYTGVKYRRDREALLRSLAPGGVGFFA